MSYIYTTRYIKPEKKLGDLEFDLEKAKKEIELKDNHIHNLEHIIGAQNQTLAKVQRLKNIAKKMGLRNVYHGLKKTKGLSRKLLLFVFPEKSDRRCLWLRLRRGKVTLPFYENPKVTIIIPAYNQLDYTYACLISIAAHSKEVAYEVILADDKSTDGTKSLPKYVKNLRVARTEGNLGFLKNCNNAASYAKGEYILFLNNDTQVSEDWLSSLLTLIENDPKIGMVGSKLVYPDGKLQEAGGILWSDGTGWNYGRGEDPRKPEFNYVKEVDYISGAVIMLSRQLWNDIGGFDERFAPAYCEDSDLAFEVRKRGLKVVYQPKSVVYHFEGISNGTDVSAGTKQYQVENSKKLHQKWKSEFALQYENNLDPDAFAARERLMGKKLILFVDHYVPTYDQDAGSKTTFQYLKMFISKGYVVKFIGDNFASQEPYTQTLQQMGIEVLHGEELQNTIFDWILKNQRHVQFAYLNRPHIASKYVDFIRENTRCKIIYYGHDLHFLRERREYELTGNPENKEQSEYWKTIELNLMYKADISYYPSYIEREEIKLIDPSIPVKAITAYCYETFLTEIQDDFSERNGLLFVGGFSHTPNTDAVLWFVKEVWPLIRKQQDIPLAIVGSHAPEEITALAGDGVDIKGFVSEDELRQLYASSRMVVVPLRYGAGIKGKVIEAIYYGVPVVTTSIGAEGIQNAGDILAIADSPDDFSEKVLELYSDTDNLREIYQKSQALIRNDYSIDKVWDIIRNDFQ